MKYGDYEGYIEMVFELRGVYDGWSIARLTDGTLVNRWANDEGTGPEPGYERKYEATELAIAELKKAREEGAT